MRLTDFLVNMQDTGRVLVEAKQLRKYAQTAKGWEDLVGTMAKTNSNLRDKVDRLEAKLALKEIEEPATIDLFA